MQISKLSFVIWAVAVCASLVSVRAQDNPAQAAARAALLEQMNAQDATPPAAPNAPTPPPVAEQTNQIAMPVTAPTAAMPATQPPMTTPQPAPAMTPAPSGDNPEQAAARAALFEAMQVPNPAPATPAPAAVPAPPVAPAPVVSPMMPATNVVAAQPPMEPVQPKPAPPAGMKPIVAPPLPISMTKEQQLQALNAKYIANQISPEEYFKQREAIISGP